MTFLIQQTLIYAVPLMIVALAGVFAERSGIINLALEGIMIFGAFAGVLFVNVTQKAGIFSEAKAAGDWVALQGFMLLAMLVLYKVTAAVVEPVAEGRLVKALSAAGGFSRLLLAALFTADVMFLFAVLSMAAQV